MNRRGEGPPQQADSQLVKQYTYFILSKVHYHVNKVLTLPPYGFTSLLFASHFNIAPYTRLGSSRATAYNFVINLLFLCAAFSFRLVPFALLVIYLTALSVTWSL
jgi:hypothetical protein